MSASVLYLESAQKLLHSVAHLIAISLHPVVPRSAAIILTISGAAFWPAP